ncbi:DDE-type integrase/transposase/recombinase [uncultured Erythrobacter sp.]|uniref:DDE-type integrase/transposase/recombinase n=1 Tax=uncultured Erythrobacter sp. TaxID=263913 RepID=UPI00344CE849
MRENDSSADSAGEVSLATPFANIDCEKQYLWRAVAHRGEILECEATKKRDRSTAT